MASLAGLAAWPPTAATVLKDLTFVPSQEMDQRSFQGIALTFSHDSFLPGFFNNPKWTVQTALHWEIPLTAVALYIVMIPTMKWVVKMYGKWDVRTLAMCWNAFLSIFSFCGVITCVPVLVGGFLEHGLYFTACAPPQWYSTGISGFFVALFIFSKLAELFDTFLLLAAKKPVIALQWWHHSTVLLYCWHSYSTRIATGMWFAAMNYMVHSVMYGYFAVTATRFRKYVSPFAIFITLGQLLQMVVGMFVTVKAVLYQSAGMECHVNKTNSILGLTMYFSYFVLFLILFINNYCTTRRKNRDLPAKRRSSNTQLLRKTSETLIQEVSLPQVVEVTDKKKD